MEGPAAGPLAMRASLRVSQAGQGELQNHGRGSESGLVKIKLFLIFAR